MRAALSDKIPHVQLKHTDINEWELQIMQRPLVFQLPMVATWYFSKWGSSVANQWILDMVL